MSAGEPIATRWSSAHKAEIKRSRVVTTRRVVDAINSLPAEQRPKVLLSTSAIGEQLLRCRTRVWIISAAGGRRNAPPGEQPPKVLLSTSPDLIGEHLLQHRMQKKDCRSRHRANAHL